MYIIHHSVSHLYRLLASDFEQEGRVSLLVHTGSLGGRSSYSFITEFTFKNISHVTKIASNTFKREQKLMEMFVNLKYKSPNCTLLIWSLRGCTR